MATPTATRSTESPNIDVQLPMSMGWPSATHREKEEGSPLTSASSSGRLERADGLTPAARSACLNKVVCMFRPWGAESSELMNDEHPPPKHAAATRRRRARLFFLRSCSTQRFLGLICCHATFWLLSYPASHPQHLSLACCPPPQSIGSHVTSALLSLTPDRSLPFYLFYRAAREPPCHMSHIAFSAARWTVV
jgi:hypothetical protein